MKKLVLLLAVVCSAALFSCAGKAEKAAPEAEAPAVEEVADSAAVEAAPADSVAVAE